MASHSYLLHMPFRPTRKFVKTAHGPQDVIPPAESTTTDWGILLSNSWLWKCSLKVWRQGCNIRKTMPVKADIQSLSLLSHFLHNSTDKLRTFLSLTSWWCHCRILTKSPLLSLCTCLVVSSSVWVVKIWRSGVVDTVRRVYSPSPATSPPSSAASPSSPSSPSAPTTTKLLE